MDLNTLQAESEPGRSEMADGTRVAPETARRLTCDAALVPVHKDERGEPPRDGWSLTPHHHPDRAREGWGEVPWQLQARALEAMDRAHFGETEGRPPGPAR